MVGASSPASIPDASPTPTPAAGAGPVQTATLSLTLTGPGIACLDPAALPARAAAALNATSVTLTDLTFGAQAVAVLPVAAPRSPAGVAALRAALAPAALEVAGPVGVVTVDVAPTGSGNTSVLVRVAGLGSWAAANATADLLRTGLAAAFRAQAGGGSASLDGELAANMARLVVRVFHGKGNGVGWLVGGSEHGAAGWPPHPSTPHMPLSAAADHVGFPPAPQCSRRPCRRPDVVTVHPAGRRGAGHDPGRRHGCRHAR